MSCANDGTLGRRRHAYMSEAFALRANMKSKGIPNELVIHSPRRHTISPRRTDDGELLVQNLWILCDYEGPTRYYEGGLTTV